MCLTPGVSGLVLLSMVSYTEHGTFDDKVWVRERKWTVCKTKKVLQQTQEIKSPKFVKNTYILSCNFRDICVHSEIIGITIWWKIARKKTGDGDFLKRDFFFFLNCNIGKGRSASHSSMSHLNVFFCSNKPTALLQQWWWIGSSLRPHWEVWQTLPDLELAATSSAW